MKNTIYHQFLERRSNEIVLVIVVRSIIIFYRFFLSLLDNLLIVPLRGPCI